MIGPGGLLLVIPTYMRFPVTVLLLGLRKEKKELNLDILFYYPNNTTNRSAYEIDSPSLGPPFISPSSATPNGGPTSLSPV